MHVAHVITRLILGGAQENTLFNCADLIHKYQDDVLLITGPPLGPEGSLTEAARRQGIRIEPIDSLRRNLHPVRDAVAYRGVRKALARYGPDVVHTHSAKAGILGRAAAFELGVPVIVHTVHGAPFHPYQRRVARELFRGCERWAARYTHAFISVADAMTDLMVQARVAPREMFTTIYSGMDVEPFLAAEAHRAATRARLGYEPGHVVIGKIARLFHLKGHSEVIEAARGVVAARPEVRFLFIGDGLLRDELARQIDRAGLTEHFQFTGLVPPSEIPALIGAMDVVVHASLREGLARALPQALIAGRPVVSYDIDGAREVVVTDETGILVEPRDVQGLQAAMIRLAGNATLRQRLGRTGQERYTDAFRHETMTRQIRELYTRLLDEAKSGPLPLPARSMGAP